MTHDAADSRRRILDAAIAAFARDGLAGARVDAIAAAAAINKRMLYHYYGDKQALFDAALDAAVARVASALAAAPWQRAAVDVDAWRLLTATAAATAVEGQGRQRIRAGLDLWLDARAGPRGARALLVLGFELLEALLPGWIEAELGPFESAEVRHRAAAAAVAALLAGSEQESEPAPPRAAPQEPAAPKPRLKLKPSIQPAGMRSPSNSSK